MKLTLEQDRTGIAPSDSQWTCVDDDTYGGPGSLIGSGATPEAAVRDFLEQLDDDDLDCLWWDARSGFNGAWMPQIEAESVARAPLNPHRCLDYGKRLGRAV